MSFLKNIMSPFLEFKKEEVEPSTGQAKTPRKENSKALNEREDHAERLPSPPSTTNSPSVSPGSSVAGEYHKHFEDLIEEANANNTFFQGTDFKEFIDSKIDVEAIADEATRYKTAFNVLKRTGLTKDRLVSTGNEYLNIIKRDLQAFIDAYTQQYKKEVEQNELLLQKKAAELHTLNEKITALNQEIKQVSQDISLSKEKLNANKEAFISAGEDKTREIELELQKIDQYF